MNRPAKSLYEQRESVIRAIDMGQWKHSWHLPIDRTGDVAWFSVETHRKIVEILKDKRTRLLEQLRWVDEIEIPPESDYE